MKKKVLRKKVKHLQFRVDSLMLEYCPDEMTKKQKKNWAKHQRPVDKKTEEKIELAVGAMSNRG